jgi:hypothetical protein
LINGLPLYSMVVLYYSEEDVYIYDVHRHREAWGIEFSRTW